MNGSRRRAEATRGHLLLLPTTLWLGALLIGPLVVIIAFSLGTRGINPPVRFDWAHPRLESYRRALDPDFLPIFGRSLLYAATATVCCIALGFPLAYWIARRPPRHRTLLLVLAVVPFLTSDLIRMYAWQFILQRNGLLNAALGGLGLGDDRTFLNTPGAVILGLTYGFLPFMVLPLYAAVERMDPTLVEASHDLGHGRISTFRRVILPSVMTGVVAGTLLVFIPALGDFVTPALLGGTRTVMYGSVIQDQFRGGGNNWPLGSAMAVLLMFVIMVGVIVELRRSEDGLP
ncbi:MAG: ABC transporter permease [Actinomycetota bacterium]